MRENRPELIPSFFLSLQSPSVEVYKEAQKKVVASQSKTDIPVDNIFVEGTNPTLDRTDHTDVSTAVSSNFPDSQSIDKIDQDASKLRFASCNFIEEDIQEYTRRMKEDHRQENYYFNGRRPYRDYYEDEKQDGTSSVVSAATTVSRRRHVEAKNQLMTSFANFVNSLDSSAKGECVSVSCEGAHTRDPRSSQHRGSVHPASLSIVPKSNHSYFEKTRRRRRRRRRRNRSICYVTSSSTTTNISDAESPSTPMMMQKKNHTSHRSYLNSTAAPRNRSIDNTSTSTIINKRCRQSHHYGGDEEE